MGIMQKLERQCFYMKKVMLLCVFLFFNLATPESQRGTGYSTQQAESTRREEQRGVSRRIEILNQFCVLHPSLKDLWELYEALKIEHEETPVEEHQVFQLRENNGLYEVKLDVTNDYILIPGNTERARRIKERLETDKGCSFCLKDLTKIEDKGKIFVSGCNQVSHIFHYNCYLRFKDTGACPCCQGCFVDPQLEEILSNRLIAELLHTGKVNHLENTTSNPSYWKLHLRDKSNETTSKTRIPAANWFIVDKSASESNMKVLEIPLDRPKDLEKNHLTVLESFKFQKIKFNNDKEAREIFMVTANSGELQLYHKENIDDFKTTKSICLFTSSLCDVSIGLQGDEIIPKEDFEDIFITNNEIILLCDNVNNFFAMKTTSYGLLSPIDLPKIAQIKDMKNKPKLLIEEQCVVLEEDDCFLIPLFDFSATIESIFFKITPQMMERESFLFNDSVKELKEMFTGVEIRGEELKVVFENYAVILLFYFSEDALKVQTIDIDISKGMENCELDRIKGLINNQPISKQQAQLLALKGELFDFAIETKIIKNNNFKGLYLETDKNNLNDSFICKENDLSTIIGDLDKLILEDYAIKYLLYFKKGINEIKELEIFCGFSDDEILQWMLGILERIKSNGIIFHIPSMDSLKVSMGWYTKEIESKLEKGIVSPKKNLESY